MWQLKTERPQRDTEYLDRGEQAQRGDQQHRPPHAEQRQRALDSAWPVGAKARQDLILGRTRPAEQRQRADDQKRDSGAKRDKRTYDWHIALLLSLVKT